MLEEHYGFASRYVQFYILVLIWWCLNHLGVSEQWHNYLKCNLRVNEQVSEWSSSIKTSWRRRNKFPEMCGFLF